MVNGGEADAVVGFSGVADLAVLKLLRPGFRHCLVAVYDSGAGGWILVNPLAHRTEVGVMAVDSECPAQDVALCMASCGYRPVMTVRHVPPQRLAPVRLFSCVEAVKRVLGRRWPMVLTPWQLYRALRNENKDLLIGKYS